MRFKYILLLTALLVTGEIWWLSERFPLSKAPEQPVWTVVSKEYVPAHNVRQPPIIFTSPFMLIYPPDREVGDAWILNLEAKDGERKTILVPKEVYEKYREGDIY
jgi:hypothetical protein